MSATQTEEREPIDIFRSAAKERLGELFPQAGDKVTSIIDSFIIDVLIARNIPSELHRMMPEKQSELLLSVGANSVEEATKIILGEIPGEIINFYTKKINNPVKKFDVDTDVEGV